MNPSVATWIGVVLGAIFGWTVFTHRHAAMFVLAVVIVAFLVLVALKMDVES